MELFSLPEAKYVGMLPAVLQKLETACATIESKGANATTTEKVVNWATATFAVITVAAFDQVKNVALLALKVVPIAFNETIGKVTGLNKYTLSDATQRSEILAHVRNVTNALVVQVNALLAIPGFQNADGVAAVGKQLKVYPMALPAVTDKQASDAGVANSNNAGTAATTKA
ncbi:MAG: hypothetical protein JSR37_03345 [Verrucomicrobia bacterium]|nr:hypothetical protein [Verrucomicrobiota bacterium]MBS0637241.1 hypothetical protein [Verrucomicrobiota bacterium]